MPRKGPKPRTPEEYAGRYRPLVDLLAATEDDEVTLTFGEIEAVIGGPLPTTALVNTSYWHGVQSAHARVIAAIGWQGRVDSRGQCVRFVREG